jgi:hypothetical protein
MQDKINAMAILKRSTGPALNMDLYVRVLFLRINYKPTEYFHR